MGHIAEKQGERNLKEGEEKIKLVILDAGCRLLQDYVDV
jgi:hypothetical protein